MPPLLQNIETAVQKELALLADHVALRDRVTASEGTVAALFDALDQLRKAQSMTDANVQKIIDDAAALQTAMTAVLDQLTSAHAQITAMSNTIAALQASGGLNPVDAEALQAAAQSIENSIAKANAAAPGVAPAPAGSAGAPAASTASSASPAAAAGGAAPAASTSTSH